MEHFKLYANTVLVKGYKRAIVHDFQREKSELIPLDLYQVLLHLQQGEKISVIKNKYGNGEVIDEYVSFLKNKNYGFFCDLQDFKLFPKINFNFEEPNQVSNIVIELGDFTLFKKIVKEIDSVRCHYVTIVRYTVFSEVEIKELIELLTNSNLISFELFCPYDPTNSRIILDNFNTSNSKIISLNFFNCDSERVHEIGEVGSFEINYLKQNIKDFKHCGVFNIKNFYTKLSNYSESVSHNSCLNRKMSIDKNGDIKNCPAMQQSFGNIKESSLEKALFHSDFKKYWNITKDQVDVCKDCEFRHICTDCRAYVEKPDNIYSKPLKCGYNPYTNEWAEWSTNPLKQEAIEFYGMQDLVKKDV